MSGSCIILGCKSVNIKKQKTAAQIALEKITKVTFHKFPCNPDRRAKWLKILNLENRTINKNNVICSLHFKEKFIDRTSLVCVRLRENAVPHVIDDTELLEVTDKIDSNESSMNFVENTRYNVAQDVLEKCKYKQL